MRLIHTNLIYRPPLKVIYKPLIYGETNK